MELSGHGGRCCGMRHIHGFGYGVPGGETGAAFNECFRRFKGGAGRGTMLCEVVLTDGQLRNWAAILKEAGFVRVSRFRNINSGSVVNVLHYQQKQPRVKNDPWTQGE